MAGHGFTVNTTKLITQYSTFKWQGWPAPRSTYLPPPVCSPPPATAAGCRPTPAPRRGRTAPALPTRTAARTPCRTARTLPATHQTGCCRGGSSRRTPCRRRGSCRRASRRGSSWPCRTSACSRDARSRTAAGTWSCTRRPPARTARPTALGSGTPSSSPGLTHRWSCGWASCSVYVHR